MTKTLATLPILSVLLTFPAMADDAGPAVPPADDGGVAYAPLPSPPAGQEVASPSAPTGPPIANAPAAAPAAQASNEKTPAHPSSRRLEPIVLTESKVPQPQENVTQSVRTIYDDEMAQRPENQRNLSELLRYEPGVFSNPLSRNDANWGSAGGLGPKYNLYLLDGLPIDSFMDAMSLDPWAFERVESHRGPASVMYSNYLSGDFAGQESPLAGVTNFILRDKIEAPATKMRVGLGSYNTANAKGYQQGSEGNLHYFFGGEIERSDYTNYGTPESWLNMQRDPAYVKSKVYGKATYLFGRDDHKLSLFLHHTTHTGDVGRYNRDFGHNYDTINLAYSNQVTESLHAQLKIGLRVYDRRWGEDSFGQKDAAGLPVANPLALREHGGGKQKILPADLTFNLQHLGAGLLTFGADSQLASYRTYAETPAGVRTTQNDALAFSSGLFVQERLTFGPLTVRGGGRLAYLRNSFDLISGGAPGIDQQSRVKPLWSAGIRLRALAQLAVYANVGTSFVPPAAKSVAGTLLPGDLGVVGKNGQLPNSSLSPEKGLGSDLGVDIRPLPSLSIGLRGFFNQVSDQIVDNSVSDVPSQSQSINAGRARSYGGELTVEQFLGERVSWFANGTYTVAKLSQQNDPDQDGANIPFVPTWTGNAGLTLRLPYRIAVSPFVTGVGTFYDSSSMKNRKSFGRYVVPSLRAAKTWVAASHSVELSLVLNNLVFVRYETDPVKLSASRTNDLPWQFRDPGFNGMAYLLVSL
jgi:iron complex outermembrane recepter protein